MKSNFLKNNLIKKIYFFLVILKINLIEIISLIFYTQKIQEKKIVINHSDGKKIGGNIKSILEEINKRGEKYDIVCLLNHERDIETVSNIEGVRFVKNKSLKALYELTTSKIWIDNSRKSFSSMKRKGQYYIQTWHSPLRLKKIEKDAEKQLSLSYKNLAIKDSRKYNVILAGNDFSYDIYRKSFWYDGKILKTGTPRCDVFFKNNDSVVKNIKKYYNIDKDSKILLFAPTFRDFNNSLDNYRLDFDKIIETLEEKTKLKWCVLSRLHPRISEVSKNLQYDKNIINATDYPDMQELLVASDLLITDYSSSMFDMLIAKKPCLLHTKDLKAYLENERGLYFEFNELPFLHSRTDDELIYNIEQFDLGNYNKELETFSKRINLYEDGKASVRIVNLIEDKIGGN